MNMKAKVGRPRPTPIADALERPSEASEEQWATYVAAVRSAEASGYPNPTYGVQEPWKRKSTSRRIWQN